MIDYARISPIFAADIVIERDGRLIVRAPEDVPDEGLRQIVTARRYWIYKKLAEWRDLNATRVLREYCNGEGFLYLGRSYRLSLVADQNAPLLLKDGRFQLRRDLVDAGEVEAAKRAFQDYYVARGAERIVKRVQYYAPKAGVDPKSVVVRELGYRWASCSPSGSLSFHWKCMMAPLTIIDYFVVHELCHLHHKDHTDSFWNEVDKVLPSWHYQGWLQTELDLCPVIGFPFLRTPRSHNSNGEIRQLGTLIREFIARH